MLEAVCGETESVLQKGCLPILIGGEHTISIAGVAACLRHYPNLCVVQIDAHLDLRDEYNNQWLNHACTMRRIADFSVPFFQIGIRSFSKEEWYLCKSQKWSPWTQERIRNHPDWHDQLGKEIDERPVYLTFDFDSLDPAVLPATGTPEPDGLSWRSATHLLHYLCSHTNIIGADFVEFSPAVGPAYGAFTAAKLIYRTIGYIFSNRIKLTEEENDN